MAENSAVSPPANPLVYSYIKFVAPDVLSIQFKVAGIGAVIRSIDATKSMVTIQVTRPLTEDEQKILYTVVANHVNPTISLDVAKARVSAAMDFGKQLIIEFSATNVVKGITVAQVKQLSGQFAGIQLLLMNGSLYSALDAIQGITPNSLITQDEINYFANKIMDFLGIKHG